MYRWILSAVVVLGSTAWTRAHFLFVVPETGARQARVILSEDLDADDGVDSELLAGVNLRVRNVAGGEATLLKLGAKSPGAYLVELPAGGHRVITGQIELGVRQRGDGPAYLIQYFAKTVVGGDGLDGRATAGDAAPVEIMPMGAPGKLRLKVLADKKPVAAAEVNVIAPDGARAKVTTDRNGLTPVLEAKGRYGAWVRHIEAKPGEAGGKKYAEIRRYATLVVDAIDSPAPALGKTPAVEAPALAAGRHFADLPQAASSAGAVAVDGWLYVYGGHVAKVHTYSTEAVSGRFHRLNLKDGKTWEELPGGPALQGMNLAAHGGKIYRVGGMQPRNKPGEKADMHSVADAAVFDPATKTWTALPPLPEARSSHDLVVAGDTLIVVGGWNMKGRDQDETWFQTMLTLDLKEARPTWKEQKQPFQRRALIAGMLGNKLYVFGGLDAEGEVVRDVDVYDIKEGAWSKGPPIPGAGGHMSFSPACATVGGRLYLSVADGTLLRLDEAAKGWTSIGKSSPRVVHRMVPHDGSLLVVGGAFKADNLASIEAIAIKP